MEQGTSNNQSDQGSGYSGFAHLTLHPAERQVGVPQMEAKGILVTGKADTGKRKGPLSKGWEVSYGELQGLVDTLPSHKETGPASPTDCGGAVPTWASCRQPGSHHLMLGPWSGHFPSLSPV